MVRHKNIIIRTLEDRLVLTVSELIRLITSVFRGTYILYRLCGADDQTGADSFDDWVCHDVSVSPPS